MSQKYNDYLKTDYWKKVSEAVKKRAQAFLESYDKFLGEHE